MSDNAVKINQDTLTVAADENIGLHRHVLVAVDSSDHSNRGIAEAVSLAKLCQAEITGTHVYAAKMHDIRFRQMEGGLPEQFREEQELERQRTVHDDLITRGLSIITDSYLDQADKHCKAEGIPFTRRSLEGKNYRALVNEANSGAYDFLIMGALGLGAIAGSRLGTVCQRVVRRTSIDTLVIKDPQRSLADGPIAVAVDGSTRSYGGLKTALALAREWEVPVHVLAAFDPYYHYVAFNRIAGVLSEEAGKVFRFQEQEKLHEEIIDSGLAKIYEGHLAVAKSIAEENDQDVETVLLDGKPHDAIEKYLTKINPSLLVIGKVGIHADPDLDIGGNAEHLLRNVDCAVLLSQKAYQPQVDVVADVTTSWTKEAENRMDRVPSFVRNMARLAILRYAQERGHTVITERIVEDATAELMPAHAEEVMQEIVATHDASQTESPATDAGISWSDDSRAMLAAIDDPSLRSNVGGRAEKKARIEGSQIVEADHLAPFLEGGETTAAELSAKRELHWQSAALARLMGAPEGFMRDAARKRIEDFAREAGHVEITLELAEKGLTMAREAMEEVAQAQRSSDAGTTTVEPEETATGTSKCPFVRADVLSESAKTAEGAVTAAPQWTTEAKTRLQNVPYGFCRDMTRKAAETIAARSGVSEIDDAFVEKVMLTFQAGAEKIAASMAWADDARARIARAPEMVRGMLIQEIEGWAQRNGLDCVDSVAVDEVKRTWRERAVFHLRPDDPRGLGGQS